MKKNFLKQFDYVSRIEERLAKNRLESTSDIAVEKSPEITFESILEKFKQGIDSNTSYDVNKTAQLEALQHAEEKAALSGRFNPNELIDAISAENDIKDFVLSSLARDCVIETIKNVEWLLSQSKRKEVLMEIMADRALDRSLLQDLPPTDLFGEMLRRVIAEGKNLNLSLLSQEELLTLASVLETTAGIDFLKPDIVEVKKIIHTPELLANYENLSAEFVGRDEELKTLIEFLSENSNTYDWSGIILTGLGGVGKSTLLAKFTSEVVKKKLATTVILDFDRPGIDARDPFWLELEITRQVGIQCPEWEKKLSEDRHEARQLKMEGAYDADISSQKLESVRFSKNLLEEVKNCLEQSIPDKRPFLLILDTLEEVTQRFLLGELQDWISYLPYKFAPFPVKIIFSGRLYQAQLEEVKTMHQTNNHVIEIKDFDFVIARKFLEKKLAPDVAEKVVQSGVVPLRPLELKLVADLLREGTTTIEDLVKDLKEGNKNVPVSELFSGMIYRRVLMRIGHPVLREMAYPGLILRYLTADLIEKVLQPALKLNITKEEPPAELLNKLLDYSWLAYKDPEGDVWHSKELRRSMLRLMITQEPDKVKLIREKAIEYFESLHTEKGDAESIYHRLMMITDPEDGASLELSALNNASKLINVSIGDLSRPAAILLQFASTEQIREVDLVLLPDKYFKRAYEKAGRRLVADRQFSQAYQLFQRAKKIDYVLQPSGKGILDKWEKELLFACGSWEELTLLPSYQLANDKKPTMLDVVAYVFPAAIVQPEDVDRDFLDKMFRIAVKDKKQLDHDLGGPENFNILTRLSYALTLLHTQKPLPENTIRVVKEILEITNTPKRSSNIEKSLLLLQYIAFGRPVSEYHMNPSLICLDKEWLDFASTFIHDPGMDSMIKQMTLPSIFSKELLSQTDQSKAKHEWKDATLNLEKLDPETQYRIVKGPQPVFRDPCRYAILDLYPTRPLQEKLATIFQSVLKVQYKDLESKSFADSLSTSMEIALGPYIELVDRSWALGDLLSVLRKESPNADKLNKIADAYEEWERSLTQLILNSKKS